MANLQFLPTKPLARISGGQYEGKVINYYPSGVVRSHLLYSNGLRNGPCYKYNKDGNVNTLNYCLNDTTIYGEFYKYSPSGEIKIEKTFNPIIVLEQDTLYKYADSLKFTVDLPIPDSLITQKYSIFKYGFKPLSLKDSIFLKADNEVKIFYDTSAELVVKLEAPTSQIFYGYIYDEEKRAVYSPFERIITVVD